MPFDNPKAIWPVSLQIEETVAAQLGSGRVTGNAAAPCPSRQVSISGEARVWPELAKIGRFYNCRHHTTVLHAIAKVERLLETHEAAFNL
jgi:hypothetical protein